MLRRAIFFLGLMLLLCAAARAEQGSAQQVVASPALAVGQRSAILELAGSWSGRDWGELVLNADGTGTYTDTFGTGPGQVRFDRTGDHSYMGTWRESDLEHHILSSSRAGIGEERQAEADRQVQYMYICSKSQVAKVRKDREDSNKLAVGNVLPPDSAILSAPPSESPASPLLRGG